jgi:hypothetical protein
MAKEFTITTSRPAVYVKPEVVEECASTAIR